MMGFISITVNFLKDPSFMKHFLQDFSPEQYFHLAKIFGLSYLKSGSPVSIVAHYLSAYTKGNVSNPPEACEPFVAQNYDVRKAYTTYSLRGLFYCN